ncbi:PaaI family thioesterase [Crenalkalicoccus roseus]|uniref:PaaI family thioesterase n=1 Tax=Crenalkalicoccus roseus TaxID=1485588 RepID=UPI001081202D|nr:PaaI family thioesterase [Crenalkalicoccus roseus]
MEAKDEVAERIPAGFVPRPVGGGFLEPFGPLYIRRGEGPSVFGLRIERRHCNAKDMAHGGMLATLADIVLGIGGLEQAGVPGFFVTVSLQTDFLGPAPLGAWVECRPELLRRTRTLMFVQGTFAAEGRPVLRASGVFHLPKPAAA